MHFWLPSACFVNSKSDGENDWYFPDSFDFFQLNRACSCGNSQQVARNHQFFMGSTLFITKYLTYIFHYILLE